MADKENPGPPCRRCGEPHDIMACPHVKSVEFAEDGERITRVEFLTPVDYPPMKASLGTEDTSAPGYTTLAGERNDSGQKG